MTRYYASIRLHRADKQYFGFAIQFEAADFRTAADTVFAFVRGVEFASTFEVATESVSVDRSRGTEILSLGQPLPADLHRFIFVPQS